MSWKLVWSAKAERKLLEYTGWLADRNPEAALRFVDTLEADVAGLADHPLLAPVWDAYPRQAVRRLLSGSYLVYNEVREGTQEVYILTVRHARERPPLEDDVRSD